MTPEQITTMLAAAGLPGARATPIHGGWASWTFDVNGTHILRVARTEEIAASHRREARLLPELAAVVDFAVPVPSIVDEHDGLTFMVYRKVTGRPFAPGDPLPPVAAMLRDLHSFPVRRAAKLVDADVDPAAWRTGYEADRRWITDLVVPRLDAALAREVLDRFDAILPSLSIVEPVLVHRDLGTEHLLVDPDTGFATGMIDFETATVGDATIDFVGLLATLGDAATSRLISHYGSSVSWRRLRFYSWMGSVHAIRYGVESGDAAIVADGIDGLRARITLADAGPRADS